MGTAANRSSALTEYYKRGQYIPGIKVNGMDVLATKAAVKYAKDYAVAVTRTPSRGTPRRSSSSGETTGLVGMAAPTLPVAGCHPGLLRRRGSGHHGGSHGRVESQQHLKVGRTARVVRSS